MADNVEITAGSGTTIATDDVGGVQYQKVKVDFGGDGASAPVTAATGLPVDATGQGDVPITLDGEDVGLDAGENHVGQVGMEDDTVTITCSLDTDAYADGDVLFDTQEIAGAVRNNGETCILQSIHVIDIDDQGEDFDLVFFNAATSLGTENSAPDINDTEVLTTLGVYEFVNAYMDLGANQVRTDTGIGLLLEAGAATTSLYVAGISRGTGTYTANGIRITFGFLRN
jgi:hypothetical protein